ncbi:putative ABC transporter ATP-binding protein [Anopheles sinensis]|uniref:Putative ABC transporter ATP-binding protein n=1 Tax=Anopheles sinensis TaxID=74873 RepID=A0A084W4H2_ANOSI|nr:putative ABC transporter ATP-binding protein [Anopheles sinensis]
MGSKKEAEGTRSHKIADTQEERKQELRSFRCSPREGPSKKPATDTNAQEKLTLSMQTNTFYFHLELQARDAVHLQVRDTRQKETHNSRDKLAPYDFTRYLSQ